MLSVDQIHTYYGDSHILQGVSFGVEAGQAVALLGRNGAGKTTTISSIVGFAPSRAGSIRFRGQEISRAPSHRIARMGMGLVPQGRRIFPNLTVQENLTLAMRPGPAGASWDLERIYGLFPRLRERATNWGNQLSGGEQQMLAIGRALAGNPALLVLDEPSEGLAPLVVAEIGRAILQLKREGMAILLVEQHFAVAMAIADEAHVLNKGQIVFRGPAAALQADEELKHRFLGV
jgi:branched-chain amino acid transport system ATP-binding protein